MRKLTLAYAFLSLILFVACNTTHQKDKLHQLMKDYNEESLKIYPLNATFQGDTRYNDYLPNFLSNTFIEKEKEFYNRYRDALLKIDNKALDEEDILSKKVLLWECDINLKRLEYPVHLLPINQMWTLQLTMGQLAGGTSAQPFKSVADYQNWLLRVDDYLIWLASAEERMREGIEKGVVLPKSLIKKVVPQLYGMAFSEVEDHLFYSPIKNLPTDFLEDDKQSLRLAYQKMISEKVKPAYEKLHDFMAGDYMTSGRESSGFDAYDFGESYYDYAIKLYTTTSMNADEIHRLGISEVARLRSEMEKVKKQVGFEGDLNSFFDHVRTLPKLRPFTDPQQVINNFNAIHEKMKDQVDRLFSLQPKTAFEVRRTEAFREASASAQYNPGSLDGSRPGIFYVPIPDVSQYNIFSDEDLFLHEAIPGHHFQISLQQENTNLPDFRKTLWYSAYGEGWALYCESLGEELGLYDDPYQYFGMLSAEMHRAIRLVVDTGLHTKGWTREQAIQYSLKNEAEPEASIISEIERYMANPGQALSYKIGQLKIQSLRAQATEVMGEAFDIREFHRLVLESGCIPLALLEEKIENWIQSKT
jgi:uncharacterized protein (DUF885 family)